MEAVCPFETSEAVYPTTQFDGPEGRKGRLHGRRTRKTLEFVTVYKILRQQKFAALRIRKLKVNDTRQSNFLSICHWQISQKIQDII